MANKPDDPHAHDPKRPSKDDESAIPSAQPADPGSDSAIDLGVRGEEDLSGISVIEWAKLVENPPAGDSKAGLSGVDPVSDSDLAELLNAAADDSGVHDPLAAKGPERNVLDEPEKSATGSDSSIDLSDHALPTAGQMLRDDGSAIDLAQPVRGDGASGTRLGDDDAIELSAADALLGSSASLRQEGVRPPGQVPAGFSDSEINLGDVGGTPGSTRKTDSDVNFLAEDIVLEPASGTSGGSSRDLIAEGLESGVDLLDTGSSKKTGSKSDTGEEFLGKTVPSDESSSVDLGSMHSIPVFDMPDSTASSQSKKKLVEAAADELGDSEIDLEKTGMPVQRALTDTGSVSDLDLGEVPEPPRGRQPRPHSDDEIDSIEPEEVDEPAAVPARAEKPRGKAGAYLGGGTVGFLAGAAAFAGVWLGGLLPNTGTSSTQPRPAMPGAVNPGPDGGGPGPVIVAIEGTIDSIRSGDFDRVKEADLEKIDEAKQEQLVARASYNWLNYLRTEMGKTPRPALQADSEPVKKAMGDLAKAIEAPNPEVAADALYLRAQIQEMVGNQAAAKADYAAGATKFAGNPTQKARFETALLVLDLDDKVSLREPGDVPGLALLLIAFQPGGGEKAAGTELPEEAGFSFWQAIRQAKGGNYAEAVKLLEKARALHDQRRFLLPKKQQNPLSDPREAIFLRACDELKNYWTMLSRITDPKYLTLDAKDRVASVDALLTKANASADAAALKKVVEKLAKGKDFAKLEDLVTHLEAERKDAVTKVVAMEKVVETAKSDIAAMTTQITEGKAALAKAEGTVKTTQAALTEAKTNGQAATAALQAIGKTVKSEFKDLATSRDSLLAAVKDATERAAMRDPGDTLRKVQGELSAALAKLKTRAEPAELLPLWLTILDKERQRKDLAAQAGRDAGRVLEDATAKPETKALAQLVQGLALRNEEKYAEAQAALQKAKEAFQEGPPAIFTAAGRALNEVANPAVAIANQARELQLRGDGAEAVNLIGRGLKSVAGPKAALLAQRARIALDTARAKGPLTADDPMVTAARQDAAAAAKEGLADGYFLQGRIDEELGRLDAAEQAYKAALKLHDKLDDAGCRYRAALARVLLRLQPGPRAALPRRADGLGLLVLFTLQGPAMPGDQLNRIEAEKWADEVLKLGDKAPFDARAQALAVKGKHTQAVAEYVTGLRDKRLLNPENANDLLELVNGHPGLKRTESATTADPLRAERHYASGVNLFFAKQYADAEREFQAAVEDDGSDARYHYYLGLSRLAQDKRGADEALEQAAKLEAVGRPDKVAVSAALERVQGRLRQALNDARFRPADKAK